MFAGTRTPKSCFPVVMTALAPSTVIVISRFTLSFVNVAVLMMKASAVGVPVKTGDAKGAFPFICACIPDVTPETYPSSVDVVALVEIWFVESVTSARLAVSGDVIVPV